MFALEIANRLAAQGVGVLGATLFIGSQAGIPNQDGPFVTIVETGGTNPARRQNNDSGYQRPTAQITSRAKDYSIARSKAAAAYAALGGTDGLYNLTLSSVFYLSITTRQEPTDIGLDDNERVQFTFNIDAEKQPS